MKTLTPHSNRRQAQQPPCSGRSWCDGCDATKLGNGEKCKKCGSIQGNIFRLKKLPPNLDEWD
jgi:hypothetical protein